MSYVVIWEHLHCLVTSPARLYTVTHMETIAPFLQRVALWAVPLLLAVILHELAHGYVAYRLGDSTAARAGRLTLNPFAHIDPFGTVLLPALLLWSGAPFLFGYAKPVPVNFMNLRDPRRDMVRVAAAGPLMNLGLAVLSALLLKWLMSLQVPHNEMLLSNLAFVAVMLEYSVVLNVILAVFNLLPLPPLDGGRVAVGLLPRAQALTLARLEPYGMVIVMVLLMTGVLSQVLHPLTALLVNTLL
jgi:Zn-dependent protease